MSSLACIVAVVFAIGMSHALGQRDAARVDAAAEEARADTCAVAVAKLNDRAEELREHVRTHLALDDERCCVCEVQP